MGMRRVSTELGIDVARVCWSALASGATTPMLFPNFLLSI